MRNLRVLNESYDVAVIGGGMSGICAAIASAREGAKTVLLHARSVLGGNASSEVRMHIVGASRNGTKKNAEETGILNELLLENKAVNRYHNFSTWDRVLLKAVQQTPNLTLHMNLAVDSVEMDGDAIAMAAGYQQTTETFYHITAKQFIDCTGHGSVAYMAGADYTDENECYADFQEPHAPEQRDKNHMGSSLLLKAVDRGEPVPFVKPDWAYRFTEDQLRFRVHAAQNQMDPELLEKLREECPEEYYRLVETKDLDYGFWWMEVGGDRENMIHETEEIRDELMACVYGVWDHLKNGGDHGAENYDLLWVGMLPGVRESRRFEGDDMLTESDILANKRFDDTVAYGGWPMDNHTPNGLLDYDKLPTTLYNFPGVYGLPYRIFYSKNVPNLFLAGKIISCSKLAMSSTRVMGTCAVGGQAVGTAAALAIKYNCDPPDINDHMDELQQKLLKDDCYLPGIANHDEEDLARRAKVFAEAGSEHPEAVINGVTRNEQDVVNEWTSALLPARLWLQWDESICLSELQITFDTNLSRSIKQTMSSKRIKEQTLGLPPELTKDYSVVLYEKGKEVARQEVRGNYQRMNRVAFPNVRCDKAEIIVLATYGDSKARIFEVRAYSESK